MRALATLVLCSALVLPITATSQVPTPEETYAVVFVRLGLSSVSRFAPCYQGRREEMNAVKDRIRSVRVTINPDGHVGAVVPTPRNVMSPDVLACFLTVVRSWSVPPPPNGRPLRLRFLRRHFF